MSEWVEEGAAFEFRSGNPRGAPCSEHWAAGHPRALPRSGGPIADRAREGGDDHLAGEADTESQSGRPRLRPKAIPW